MNEPVMQKPTWAVWTTDAIYGHAYTFRAQWCWAAHGPRGSQSGVEESAETACHKAHAAMYVLSNEEPSR